MTESLLVNGVALDTYAIMLADSSGLMTTPPVRDTGIPIPGAHGVLAGSAANRYDPGRIVLKLAVHGSLPDGTIPGGSTELREFHSRRAELISMFHANPVNVDWTPEVGVVPVRRAVCRLDDQLSFTRLGVRADADVDVVLEIPGAFWSEITPITASATVASGGVLSLSSFAPSNAPITDGVVTFGPCSNPSLIQGGTFVAYDGVISAGRQLVVDCSDWSVGTGSGTAWTPSLSALRYSPGPSWFELDPTASLSLSFVHTGGGTAFVSFTARRRFLAP